MTIENAQLVLQIISVIGVPILTAMITWITSSLRKTNKRIDDMESRHYENRLEDMERRNKLEVSISSMEAKQEASLRELQGMRIIVDRINDYLLKK